MSNTQSTDELIVFHMNELKRLVQQELTLIESTNNLDEYSLLVSTLESNLQRHAQQMLGYRERVVTQIAEKAGNLGASIYGRELSNIRTRRFFSKVAGAFCRKPND